MDRKIVMQCILTFLEHLGHHTNDSMVRMVCLSWLVGSQKQWGANSCGRASANSGPTGTVTSAPA